MRPNHRANDALRPIRFTRHYTCHAEGSVLIEFGNTKVLCNATVDNSVPSFLKNTGRGWITAEYGMLPRSTHSRINREAARGKQEGRTVEIQRLIGRALRAAVDMAAIKDHTIIIDCDVIQADGGTRTAAITGGYVALYDAIQTMLKKGTIHKNPLHGMVAAVSVGIHKGQAILDLEYVEDSEAETDMNVIMNDAGAFIEIQGTAEGHAFRQQELDEMLGLAKKGIEELVSYQRAVLGI